jgi:hypothetical protein
MLWHLVAAGVALAGIAGADDPNVMACGASYRAICERSVRVEALNRIRSPIRHEARGVAAILSASTFAMGAMGAMGAMRFGEG